ncbi:putative HTH-type transcriptional regulator [compost metagenome]
MAAAQIDALALVGLQAQLDNCFQLLSQGRRTAVPRHQTLKAALDWSYERLSPLEQSVLQQLAVFKMAFTQDAAIGVISCDALPVAELIEVLDNLTLKSLLSQEQGGGVTRYRFLNTTRTYALEKLELSGDLRALEIRYAGYVSQTHRPSGGQVALQLVE